MKTIQYHFNFLFEDYGFRTEESIYDENHFGNILLILYSTEIRIKIVKDRDQVSLDIASSQEPENWFDIGLVFELIEEKIIKPLQKNDSNSSQLELIAVKLKNYFPVIQKLFDKNNFKNTKAELTKKERHRAKRLFDI